MSSSSIVNIIASLNNASIEINRYLGLIIFIFGLFGNVINLLVLSQKQLRSNSCAWLFLTSTIADTIAIVAALMSRFLSTWSADLTSTNQFLCKFRAFLLFNGMTIAAWLIALATVDRWLSSSSNVNRRQQSTLKNAQRGALLIVILATIFEIQHLYCFEANLTNGPLKCYTTTVLCSIASDLSFALVTLLFPLIVMIIFGLMTISNLRKAQARLRPQMITMNDHPNHGSTTTNTRNQNQRKKTDRHLMLMLFIQVLLMFLFTIPMAISKIYSTITRTMPKSSLQNTIENFIFNIFLLFSCVSSGMPFYVYTLSGGSVFRKAVYNLFETVYKKLTCQCN